MRTHTHQHTYQHTHVHARATPVPCSTPPEHLPDTDHAPAAWDGMQIAEPEPGPDEAAPEA